MFTTALSLIAPEWKQLKCPSVKMDNQIVMYYYNKIP